MILVPILLLVLRLLLLMLVPLQLEELGVGGVPAAASASSCE